MEQCSIGFLVYIPHLVLALEGPISAFKRNSPADALPRIILPRTNSPERERTSSARKEEPVIVLDAERQQMVYRKKMALRLQLP